jgi:hypothetical protein
MSVDECGSDGLTWVPRYGSNHHEALQLWPSEPYAIRGHFIRFVGNVRNVVLCNVTTEKRSVPICPKHSVSFCPIHSVRVHSYMYYIAVVLASIGLYVLRTTYYGTYRY